MKIQTDDEVGFKRIDPTTIERSWVCSCGTKGKVEFSNEYQRIRCTKCNSLTFQTKFGTIRRVK